MSEADVPKGFNVIDVSHNMRSRVPADQTIFFLHLVLDDEGVAARYLRVRSNYVRRVTSFGARI